METAQVVSHADGPRRSWLARNWLWFVPVFLVVLVILAGAAGAGWLFWSMGKIKSSDPYQMTLQQVQSDPQVLQRLGEPVEDAFFVQAVQWSVTGDRGDATLTFNVSGPTGTGHVRSQARMIGGVWGLTTVDVTFEDGQKVSLEIILEESADDAPRWSEDEAPQASEEDAPEQTEAPTIELPLNDPFPSLPE